MGLPIPLANKMPFQQARLKDWKLEAVGGTELKLILAKMVVLVVFDVVRTPARASV